MIENIPAIDVAGRTDASAPSYASVRMVPRSRAFGGSEGAGLLPDGPVGIVPAQGAVR